MNTISTLPRHRLSRGLLAVSLCLGGGLLSGCLAEGEQPEAYDLPSDADADKVAIAARVCPTGPTVEGIDVSYFQSSINWSAVASTNVEFAISRVSDGTTFIDPRFGENWNGSKSAGLIRGAYQFFRPAQNAVTQANIMIDAIGQLGDGDLPAVVDVETADGQSSATIVSKLRTWLDLVEAGTGRKPIIYAASGFWNTINGADEFEEYPLWVANYGVSCPALPDTWSEYSMWQYTDRGRVSGISGDVDRNIFNGSLEQLREFARASHNLRPMGIDWERQADGSYALSASAPADVAVVRYYVDGFEIGSASRGEGATFAESYTFFVEGNERAISAVGEDAQGNELAEAVGLIDVTANTAVFIRQTGERTYEIGLERAPAAVAAIEVDADIFPVRDGISGDLRSTRNAVLGQFSSLGERHFSVRTYNADGSLRGTLHRDFVLR